TRSTSPGSTSSPAISAGRLIARAISSAVIGVTITLLTPSSRASRGWRAHIAYVSGRSVTTTRERSAAFTTASRNSYRATGSRLNTSSNSSITTIASAGAGECRRSAVVPRVAAAASEAGATIGSATVGSAAGGSAIASATGVPAGSLVAAVPSSSAAFSPMVAASPSASGCPPATVASIAGGCVAASTVAVALGSAPGDGAASAASRYSLSRPPTVAGVSTTCRHRLESGSTPRARAGSSPARTNEDLPQPLGPTTARN